MRYLHQLLLIFFIYLISINFSNSKETAFIDIDFIIANSNIGKKVLLSINKLDKENIENLKKKINLYKNLKLA
jgi:outer membrane protein